MLSVICIALFNQCKLYFKGFLNISMKHMFMAVFFKLSFSQGKCLGIWPDLKPQPQIRLGDFYTLPIFLFLILVIEGIDPL